MTTKEKKDGWISFWEGFKRLLLEVAVGAVFAAVKEMLMGILRKVMSELQGRQQSYLNGMSGVGMATADNSKQPSMFASESFGNSKSYFNNDDGFDSGYRRRL